jgi:succinoglycan biosynthesis protein ExoM
VPTLAVRPLDALVHAIATECKSVADHQCVALVLHNGGSSEQIAAMAESAGVAYANHEPLGYSEIRNSAIDHAVAGHFDVLVMIDDDETPCAGWLASLLAPFALGADVVVGPVKTVWPAGAPARYVRSSLPRSVPDRPDGFIDSDLRSGNCAIRVPALGSLRFADRFNRAGGEDTALFRAMRAAGARCYWARSAIVAELVDENRASLRYFAGRAFAQGRSLAAVQAMMPRDEDPTRPHVARLRIARAFRLTWWAMTRRRLGHLLEAACEMAFIAGFVSARSE